MDGGVPEDVAKEKELVGIADKITKLTGMEDDSDGIGFFPNTEISGREDMKFANRIYSGLMTTLYDISQDSLDRVRLDRNKLSADTVRDYEAVVRSMEPLAAVCRALADDELPLERNKAREERHRQMADNVSCYEARDIRVNGCEFSGIEIFIRSGNGRIFERPLASSERAPLAGLQEFGNEPRNPRMKIRMYPVRGRDDFLEVRFDPEGISKFGEMTYDIILGSGDRLDYMTFNEWVGQRKGHHFSSKIRPMDLKKQGTSFTEVLQVMDDKIGRSVDPSLPFPPRRKLG